MIEMNTVAAGTELDAARDAGREGVSAGWCAWSAGDASLTFSLVVRPDVNMHAFHGLPFVAAMGMMDALAGTAATPGLGLAGKVGIQWPSDIVCGAPAFETSLARVTVNGGAGAAGMFAAVTVDAERAALGELGVDMADEVLVEVLAAAVLARVDAWAVAANALSYDYLWNEIRVKGGAYGCGFRAAGERQTAFYTYRDPAIDPSIERVARAGEWLGSFEPDEAAFEGFIVSCVSGMDAPVKPYALTKRRNTTYLAGLDPHAREERRAQMLAATPAELRSLGADVTRIAAASPTCVFGGRDVIAKSNAGFNVVDLLS